MKRGSYGYNGYRGRSTATEKLRVVAIVLAVLVVLALTVLLFGQRYIVYTDEGIRLDIPFLQQEEPDKSGPAQQDEIKVVVEAADQSQQEQPEEQPQPEELWLKAAELSLDGLMTGKEVPVIGANAVVVDLKDQWGKLGYASQLPMAWQLGVSGQEEVNESLKRLCESELYVVARISCFRDHALAAEQAYALETNPGRRWNDFDGVRWSGPANQTVQDYLIGIMEELVKLGVDEILLDNCAYPVKGQGELVYIKKGEGYPVGGLDGVIGAFVLRAQQGLEGTQVRLSLTAAEDAFAGGGESGHTPELYSTLSGRVWLKEGMDPHQAQRMLEDAGMKDVLENLVEPAAELNLQEDKNQFITIKNP